MNNKQKIIISITSIFLVLLILLGLTYAYFLTRINPNLNEKSISLTTSGLELEYGDGNTALLTSEDYLIPGEFTGTKDFTVTNNGTAKVDSYGVIIENVNNPLDRPQDMEMTITCETRDKEGNIIEEAKTVYDGTLPTTNEVLLTNSINVNQVQYYVVSLTYIEPGVSQESDMNKTIEAKINIIDTSNTIDLEGTIANYNAKTNDGYYMIVNSEPKISQITSDGKYKVVGLKQGQHTINIYNKNDEKVWEDRINIIKDEEEFIHENELYFIDDTRTVTSSIDLNSTDSLTLGEFKKYTRHGIIDKNIEYALMEDSRIIKNTEILTSFTGVETEEVGMYQTEDDYGTSWYFRGAQKNNYVNYAGLTWRVIRINGDKTVRMILDDAMKDTSGNKILTPFNDTYDDNAYVGYMYGTPGSSDYNSTHDNINSSLAKQLVDTFYENNIKTNYASYLSDTMFCGDKTMAPANIREDSTGLGYGTNSTYYSSSTRLWYDENGEDTTEATPTLLCANSATNDFSRYTVDVHTTSNTNVATNGDLTYPIGLMSADEIVFAGGWASVGGRSNPTFYLYKENVSETGWSAMTPRYFRNINDKLVATITGSTEKVKETQRLSLNTYFVYDTTYLRPVVNLKSDVLIASGDGTKGNPYNLKLAQ